MAPLLFTGKAVTQRAALDEAKIVILGIVVKSGGEKP